MYCCQAKRGVGFGECAVEGERARRRRLRLRQHILRRSIAVFRKNRQSDRQPSICAGKARIPGDAFFEIGERSAQIRCATMIPEVASAQKRIIRAHILRAVRRRGQLGGAATELEL